MALAQFPQASNIAFGLSTVNQLRSMNERGVLSSLSHLNTAQLMHDYKPFNINDLRQNVERLDYSLKNGLVGAAGLERTMNLQQLQQQQQQQQQQLLAEQQQVAQEQQQQLQQQLKQSYSAPSSPQTPTMSETQEQPKYDSSTGPEIMVKPRAPRRTPDGTEVKPYKCGTCSKSFANSSYLAQHARIHLGIKPYRCEICQRKFTQLSHLQQHIRTHTGDKPYKCRHTGCPKAFSQLSNLQSHSRCHQTDKPFKCNSCYKCFADEMTLMEHIPRHKDSKHLKTHICSLCGKSYTQETYLQKHLQKHAEKAGKQQQRHSNSDSQHHVPASGIGLNLQRQVVMNAAVAAATNDTNAAYWAKIGADNAATLAEALQQQQQQAAQQNGYNFASLQQQQELLQHHQRLVNGGAGSSGSGSGDSGGSGSTPNHSQSPNDEGENLVMRQSSQHSHLHQQHQQQQQQQQQQLVSNNSAGSNVATNYDIKTTSAFTPLNATPPHLNTAALSQQRPAAAAAYLYQQNAAAAAFPTQLISLHQIRNYAHQPGAAAAAGLLAGDHHLLGLSVTAGGKDKGQ